jgi:hypothetical protein
VSGVALDLIDGTLSGLLIDTSSGLTEFVRQRVGGSWPLVPTAITLGPTATSTRPTSAVVRRRSGGTILRIVIDWRMVR